MVYIPIYHIQNINSEHEYFHLHRMNLTSRMCCFFTGFLILFIQVELKCIIPSILYPEWLVTKSFDPHSCVLARMTEQGSSLCIIILVTSNGMSNWHHKIFFFLYNRHKKILKKKCLVRSYDPNQLHSFTLDWFRSVESPN